VCAKVVCATSSEGFLDSQTSRSEQLIVLVLTAKLTTTNKTSTEQKCNRNTNKIALVKKQKSKTPKHKPSVTCKHCVCAYHSAQQWYTIQYRTFLIIFSLIIRHYTLVLPIDLLEWRWTDVSRDNSYVPYGTIRSFYILHTYVYVLFQDKLLKISSIVSKLFNSTSQLLEQNFRPLTGEPNKVS